MSVFFKRDCIDQVINSLGNSLLSLDLAVYLQFEE